VRIAYDLTGNDDLWRELKRMKKLMDLIGMMEKKQKK